MTDAGTDDAPIAAERSRTLYAQMRNSTAAAAIVTAYMVLTAWGFTAHRVILGWLAVQVATQVVREALRRRFAARTAGAADLSGWARAATFYMVLAGLVWGATIWLFAHPAEPVTVALTLCGLYGIVGGSVPGNAYNPPGLFAFAGIIFASVLVRLLATGAFVYAVLGAASAGFAAIMIGFCRVQSHTLTEGFRIRFENVALLAALSREKAEAEAARRQAESANLAKSQFLAAASHDLRQPLYALSMFAGALKELRLDAAGRAVVADIEGSVGALEGLFDGLLDLSRLEAGVVRARCEPVDVRDLFDRLGRYFRPLAAAQAVALRLRALPVAVEGDAALIEQALSNLIGNALKHGGGGGVLVGARRAGDRVTFAVWDQGPGIAAADRERIFEAFVQLGNPERDRRRGLGLGLSIARRAVALMGADITLLARPGQGSRFGFVLPLSSRPAEPTAAATAGGLPTTAGALLFVDDDPEVRRAAAALLGRWRLPHDVAACAGEALTLLEQGRRYGLVLADQRLPGATGLDMLGEMDRRFPDADRRAALVTADFDPALLANAAAQGVPVLQKPLRPGQLRALIDRAR